MDDFTISIMCQFHCISEFRKGLVNVVFLRTHNISFFNTFGEGGGGGTQGFCMNIKGTPRKFKSKMKIHHRHLLQPRYIMNSL